MFDWLRDKLTGRVSDDATQVHLIEAGNLSNKDGNDAIRAQIAEMGDDGTQVRHVIHYAFRGNDASPVLDTVSAGLLAGYRTSPMEDNDGLVFEEHREVASEDFDVHTQTLKQDFAEIGWDYDGWECAVVTEGETDR